MTASTRLEIILAAKDLTGKVFKTVSSKLGALKNAVFSTHGALLALTGGVGVGLLAKDFLDTAIQAERFQKVMENAVGDIYEAGEAQEFLRKNSDRLGLVFIDQIEGFGQLAAAARGTKLEGDGVKAMWLSLAEATTAMQLPAERTKLVFYAMQQMMSKGKVSAEELRRQLGDNLYGAFRLAAESIGVTTAELDKMLKEGSLFTDDFAPKFIKKLHETFSEAAVNAAGTAQAGINRLTNAWFEFKKTVMDSGILDAFKLALEELTDKTKKWIRENEAWLKYQIPVKIKQISEAFSGLATAAGKLAGPLGDVAGFLSDIVDYWNKFPQSLKEIMLAGGVGALAAGPTGAAVFGGVATAYHAYKALNPDLTDEQLLLNMQMELADAKRLLSGVKREGAVEDIKFFEKKVLDLEVAIVGAKKAMGWFYEDSWLNKAKNGIKSHTEVIDNYIDLWRADSELARTMGKKTTRELFDDLDTGRSGKKVEQGIDQLKKAREKAKREYEELMKEYVKLGQAVDDDPWAKSEKEISDKRQEIRSRSYEAMEWAEKTFAEKSVALSKWAGDAMQQNFSDFFYSLTQGFSSIGDIAENVFNSIARAWADLMGQMLAQQAFGKDFKGDGFASGFVNWISGLFGSGGSFTPQYYQAPAATQMPTTYKWGMASGGYLGEGVVGIGRSTGQSYEFHADEYVIPRAKTSPPQITPSVEVNVINNSGQPVDADKTTAKMDMGKMVVSVVIDAVDRNVLGMRDMIKGVM